MNRIKRCYADSGIKQNTGNITGLLLSWQEIRGNMAVRIDYHCRQIRGKMEIRQIVIASAAWQSHEKRLPMEHSSKTGHKKIKAYYK